MYLVSAAAVVQVVDERVTHTPRWVDLYYAILPTCTAFTHIVLRCISYRSRASFADRFSHHSLLLDLTVTNRFTLYCLLVWLIGTHWLLLSLFVSLCDSLLCIGLIASVCIGLHRIGSVWLITLAIESNNTTPWSLFQSTTRA
jgi:hypothetical protein